MRRREFMRLATGSLLSVPVLGTTLLRGENLETVDPIASHSSLFLTEPYLQKPGFTEMTIRWITAKTCESWVEYGTTPKLGQKAFHVVDGQEALGRIHEVPLTNLEPGTSYCYRAVSSPLKAFKAYDIQREEPVRSPVKQFTTFPANSDSARFIVLNDLHNQPSRWKPLVDLVGSFPYDFVMLNGDIMSFIDDEDHLIRDVLRPAGDVFQGKTPFYYVRGNHETRGPFARNLKNYLTLDHNRYYYAQTIGPVRLVVLDTGEDKPDSHPKHFDTAHFESYRDEVQRQWLEQEIATPEFRNAKYRVVVHHIPPILPKLKPQAKPKYKRLWLPNTRTWRPLYKQGKVDLVISGHTHEYETFQPTEQHPYGIMIGGGRVEGKSTVLKVDANSDRLLATLVLDTGKIVGQIEKRPK